jgi:hypothetical protein
MTAAGAVIDDVNLHAPGGPRFLGCGPVVGGAAGGTNGVGVFGTAVSKLLVMNNQPGSPRFVGSIPITSVIDTFDAVPALTSDGATAALLRNGGSSWTVNFYSLPSGASAGMLPFATTTPPVMISISGDGTQIVEASGTLQDLTVVDRTGATLYSIHEPTAGDRPRFSQSGHIAQTDYNLMTPTNTTRLYHGSTRVGAISATATDWLDDTRFLASTWTWTGGVRGRYTGSVIVSDTGMMLATPPLPDLGPRISVVSSTRVLSDRDAVIYDLATGAVVWRTAMVPPNPDAHAVVTGSYVTSIAGPYVIAESY